MATSIGKDGKVYHDLDFGIFPKDVQKLEAAYAKSLAQSIEDRKALDAALQPYAPRIAVAGEKIVQPGHVLGWMRAKWGGGYRMWSEPKAKKPASSKVASPNSLIAA